MGDLAKFDPMGIDEKELYILRGLKILKEYYPNDTGTWTYNPPSITYLYSRPYPQQPTTTGWTATNTASSYPSTWDPGN